MFNKKNIPQEGIFDLFLSNVDEPIPNPVKLGKTD